jgi:hypothetical protein
MFANPALVAFNRSEERYSARRAVVLIAGVSLVLWSSLSALAISLI